MNKETRRKNTPVQVDAKRESAGILKSKTGVLHVGIDLGTSRSAVAASNGVREMVGSVVGWPKDSVSAKLNGAAPIFGDEALEKRMALNICYPLVDGNLAYPDLEGVQQASSRNAAIQLMSHLKSLCGATADQAVYAVVGAPAEATKENKQAIIALTREAGIDGVMVVSEPFAVAYALDALEDAIVIDIGAGTIDLCRMAGTLPEHEDQITIFKAGNFVDRAMSERIRKSYPQAQFTLNMIRKAKERFSSLLESESRAIVYFPVDGVPTEIDVTTEVCEAVRLIVPEVVDGIRQLVATFDPEFQEQIRSRVFVSGGGSQIFGLQGALEEGLQKLGGGKVYIVDDPIFTGAQGALKLAQEMPLQYWQQLGSN